MNDILNMQAGPKLDEIVGTKVMGWKRKYNNVSGNCWFHERGLPVHEWKPSTDLNASWEVVERMKELNWWFVLSSEVESWTAMFYWDLTQTEFEAKEATAPEAICKAALLALEGDRVD